MSPQYPVMLALGQYNEGMLRGLDYFVAQAGQRGIKVQRGQRQRCSARSLPDGQRSRQNALVAPLRAKHES